LIQGEKSSEIWIQCERKKTRVECVKSKVNEKKEKKSFAWCSTRERKEFSAFFFLSHPSEEAEIAGEKRFFAVSGSTKGDQLSGLAEACRAYRFIKRQDD
jgi:hypothetical protein